MLAAADNILRIINFLFLVICIGLVSALINTQQHHVSRVNFCMFTAAYGIATDSVYGVFANFFEPLAWPAVLLVLDFLNFAFTFSAGTVMAVGIRTHSCSNQSYLDGNSIIQGSGNRCRMSQAYTAFIYFSMFIFFIKMVMSGLNMSQNGAFTSPSFISRRRRRGGAASQGIPNISQV
ncbi:non-classical export protein 2 [Monosporozyma servazzii]